MIFDRSLARAPRDFALAVLGGCGVIALLAVAARPTIEAAAPAMIELASAPILDARVHVKMPEPPPPAAVIDEPLEVPATMPQLRAQCVSDQSGDCDAATGFPAISHDGKTILQTRHIDDGGRGYPGFRIELLDTETSKVMQSIVIADPDEYDDETGKHRAPIAKRVGTVQKIIGDGNYRSLAAIPSDSLEQLHDGARIRVDGKVYTTTFSAAAEYPGMKYDPETDMCGSVELIPSSTVAWFDAPTHALVIDVLYAFGPSCHCGSETKTYVRKVR
jgi:hypothetical protein